MGAIGDEDPFGDDHIYEVLGELKAIAGVPMLVGGSENRP
jgi:hypothetical protein